MWLRKQWARLNAALLFYTRLPLPRSWPTAFESLAKAAVLVGCLIGLLLAGTDWLLAQLGWPLAVRSALVVFGGLWLTGGLHLDGAMDTADGLAVPEAQRRLAAMADSRSGAFGVMAAIAILLLKVSALSAMPYHRGFALLLAAGWGRWGQQWAIARYPYLKPAGKGAFHKAAIRSSWETLPSLGLLIALSLGGWWLNWVPGAIALWTGLAGGLSSAVVAAWLARRLGGHTGDTYGAVVEWVEVAVLTVLAGVS
ncbi:MAG: adenosylcobinamide-GDP ribazoletransferase [Leptolyngbya sp. SIO4C1]|nr:adenosylcobinamide-GDP ribazoletransferase [Leptolyngbya sp. SIO4C1]